MSNDGRVDFSALMTNYNKQRIAPGAIQIVGGTITDSSELNDWLQRWETLDLKWRLWEEVSAIKLEESTMLADLTYLERARLFGTDGDLSLRRDGDTFYWWFVGGKDVSLPRDHGGDSFWDEPENASKSFYVIKQQAVLWGAFQGDKNSYWYDDRVGYAKLDYPKSLHGHTHVYAKYREYLDGGRIAAVWMYDLVGEKEEQTDGNG